MKIMKILQSRARILKTSNNHIISGANHANHENLIMQCENHENHENHRIHLDIRENHENHEIPCES